MKKTLVVGLFVGRLVLLSADQALAADQVDQTMDNLITWLQSRLVTLAVLTLVVGGGLLMLGQELGKRLVIGAVVGLVAVLLAKPIITSLAALVTH